MSYKFISKQTTFPSFFQYPEFLLKLPISQTGKITYMLLYDRARLSQKNNWMDENGRIFVIFPIKELAYKNCERLCRKLGRNEKKSQRKKNRNTSEQ